MKPKNIKLPTNQFNRAARKTLINLRKVPNTRRLSFIV